jgi:hypothetical protein
MRVRPYICTRCRIPVDGERYRPKFGLAIGLVGYFLTSHRYRCEHCGTPLAGTRTAKLGSRRAGILTFQLRGMQWRCEKNEHMLNHHKHVTCPIDGSIARWTPKPAS